MRAANNKFTGKQFLFIVCGSFSLIFIANLTLAYFAYDTFPGVYVQNAYIASQQFNSKLQAQKALGWTSKISYVDGFLRLVLRGEDRMQPSVNSLYLLVGNLTSTKDERILRPHLLGKEYSVRVKLKAGMKTIIIKAVAADGTHFSQRHTLMVH